MMKYKAFLFLALVVLLLGLEIDEAEAGFSDVVGGINKFILKIINSIAGRPVGKPINTHFACVNGQCILVDGKGDDECIDNSNCVGSINTCTDGTPFGSCVFGGEPMYCYGAISGGEIVNRCNICGCPSGYICAENGNCLTEEGSGSEGDDLEGAGDGSGEEGNSGGCDVDVDGDGYCNFEDCDDFDFYTNPSVSEVCDDSVDNDCDGDVDGEDAECTTCTDGDKRICGTDAGECISGVQTCVNSIWGVCEGGVSAVKEVCGDSKDNDCDGEIDENCDFHDEDSDDDGLPDDWETRYFGDLTQGWNGDADGDGLTNAEEYAGNTNPSVAEKKNRVFVIACAVGGGILIALLLLFLVSKLRKNNKGGGIHNRRKEVIEYISKARQKGFSDDEIRESLIRAGWKGEDADEFI